ncbi:ATP-dependent DNA helicase [Labilithrix luteola]|uniref:ATP-dependent DNA helicase n=2 Tax=Labilithrix luteola TaxID=1391654 RepID=A0A0K1QCL7_9BACT|nr:ATP-dependent DNA helicase [Labilithrix luteola]
MPDASAITALLGPTNTGKTYRAIERMLEHESGMIGLPLRLLAREVYDKISARVGESKVALITGEEQRIPPRPSYWVATVEAMPVDREVAFLAVDEIQLAAHDQRGHVFTSRLLSARGTKETWFLGSETIGKVLRELVPTAKIASHPRLSLLTSAPPTPLSRLPERSAVVAFSMPHVYELAERLRARRGGAAVVTGALSPRTRNAQVAMFQAGEVDYLVATDAIGMGLNLDVRHVAFAATRKFDGRDVRDVDETELAQIAGRAGRWIENGTFGTLTPHELPNSVTMAIESHRFASLRRVRYRNDDLDFASLEALRHSLCKKPTRAVLAPAADAEDFDALLRLSEREAIRALCTNEERVRLLWDVCTVPDFRKLLFEVHVDFLEELFVELARRGALDDDWMDRRVRAIGRDEGEVETLVARISATRVFTYVSNRSNWLRSPELWQEQTRALEDRLSDALHQRLVMRFVDAKKGKPGRRARPRPPESKPVLEDRPLALDKSHPFAGLAALRSALAPAPASSSSLLEGPSWVEDVTAAAPDAFQLDGQGRIVHGPSGKRLAAIVRGASIAMPDVRLADASDLGVGTLGAGAQSRLVRRLVASARDFAGDLLGPLRELGTASASATVRGLVHRLEQGLGTAFTRDVRDLTERLTEGERAELEKAGLHLGDCLVYVGAALKPRALAMRVAFASVYYGTARLEPPRGGAVSMAVGKGADRRALLAIGHPVFAGRAVRADVAERVYARLTIEDVPPGTLATWLGCPTNEAQRVVRALRDSTRDETLAS